jgi:hypothetical protein
MLEFAKVGTTTKEDTSYTDTKVATNRFTISGTARIICWGDTGVSTIEMDGCEFEADELTPEIIHANLDDGQFGCERIVGARDLCVEQIYLVSRKTEGGSNYEFESAETILDFAEIEKLKDGKVVIHD